MRRRIWFIYGIIILLTASLCRPSSLATAQELEVIMGGDLEYQNYCAVCHGVDAKGNGIMRKYLTIAPSDLTQLAKKNNASFPFWQVYRTIDGR